MPGAYRPCGRRAALSRMLGWVLLLGAGVAGRHAVAQPKQSKAAVGYQDRPRDERRCGVCRHYIAEERACKLVAGAIAPDGYCMLFTPLG